MLDMTEKKYKDHLHSLRHHSSHFAGCIRREVLRRKLLRMTQKKDTNQTNTNQKNTKRKTEKEDRCTKHLGK